MLAFALRHAQHFRKRRIVVALPFLNIVDQTASIYRDVLGPMGPHYILEHHSLAERAVSDVDGPARLASDNWDAPVIVTTTVQLLESLFANRPGRIRKLHRLADSVILLDEIQTLPLPLIIPTVALFAVLGEHFRTTLVSALA
ncbi:MAG: hypothetical protein JJ714_00120 [Acidithiobacillus sp.]|nr:hypothetical protein [Acidithiobacillus sp.]